MYKDRTGKEQNLNKLLTKHIKNNQGKIYIKTNFDSIDKLIDGFYLGELVIIGGRPVMGKTSFSLGLMKNICIDNDFKIPSIFVTSELHKKQLFSRLLETYYQNKHNKSEFAYDIQTLDNIKKSPMYILDGTGDNVITIIKKCKKLIYSSGVKLIIIDYVQLITSMSVENNRDVEITKIMVKLKKMAVKMEVVVIVLSQLSIGVEERMKTNGKGPMLCDFQESESLSTIPDKVIFIHRPDHYHITKDESGRNTEGLVEINIAKNNNGNIGKALLIYDTLNYTFENYEH